MIHRAYLAGIATSGTGSSSSSARGTNGTNGLHGSKLSDSAKLRMHLGAAAAGGRAKIKEETRDGVQWDFQSGGGGGRAGAAANPGGRGRRRGAPRGFVPPMDFLKERVDFDSMEVEPGVKRATAPPTNGATAAAEDGGEDDLELSSSLLTMSLDKDVSIDEMGISACEKNLLGRPLSSNVLDAIVLDDEQMKGLPKQNPSRSGSMLTLAPGATKRAADATVAPRAAPRHASGPGGGGSLAAVRRQRARDDVAGQRRPAKRGTAAAPAAAPAAAAPAAAAPRRQVRVARRWAAAAHGSETVAAATPRTAPSGLIAQGFFSNSRTR